MPTVLFKQQNGVEKPVEVDIESTIMEAAVNNDVDGIDAECGGSGMCATCHVYVDEDYINNLEPPDENELEMLETTSSDRLSNSRLSCQISMTDALDGIVVMIPETQS